MAMAASRFLVFGSSVLRIHRAAPATSRALFTFSPLPLALRLCETFPRRTPHLFHRCNCSSAAAAAADNLCTDSEEVGVVAGSHPWPEWVNFVDRLKSKGYFEESLSSKEQEEEVGVGGNRKELNQLKIACFSFARERFDVFKSLSREDIQTVVEKGCPSLLRKAVNSAKRLRAYARLDEGEVCSACNLRGSCDRAYVILKESETAARTVDIVRMLLIYALDPLVLSGGEKPHDRERIEESARNLLSQLNELSELPVNPALPKPAKIPPREKVQTENIGDHEHSQSVEMKRGDWICSKCNFMNFARNVRCLQCREDGPKKVSFDEVEMKKGDWTCPQCQFMNFARNRKCLRCEELRPKRELNPGEWECPSCDFLNYRRNMVCLKCNCERPKDEVAEFEEHIWKSPR